MILGLGAIFGMAAYGVDVSLWYSRKASLQSTADAAALAAAYSMANLSDKTTRNAAGLAAARKYVSFYDYNPDSNVAVTLIPDAHGRSNWVSVKLDFSQPNVFRGALGKGSQPIQVTATAQWTGITDSPITSDKLGLSPGQSCTGGTGAPAYNFSLFGLYADSTNGDNYGPMYWDSNTANPSGQNSWNNQWHVPMTRPDDFPNWPGYDFTISIDPDYVTATGSNQVAVELYDPDSWNSRSATAAGTFAADEMRPAPSATGFPYRLGQTFNDVTIYELHWTADDGTDTILGKAQYDGTAWWSDMDQATLQTNLAAKGGYTTSAAAAEIPNYSSSGPYYGGWVLPATGYGLVSGTFLINAGSYQTGGRLHLNVYTSDGTTENGFSVRAGPPVPASKGGKGWDSRYGIDLTDLCSWAKANAYDTGVDKSHLTISSHGVIPMNFDIDGTAYIDLGQVPSVAAGGQFNVERFDTDVAAQGQSSPSGQYYYVPSGLPDIAANEVWPTIVTSTPSTLPVTSMCVKMGTFGSSTNNKIQTDTIYLPTSYTSAEWHIKYSAGSNDTSTWKMAYSGGGIISLVAVDGTLY